MNIAATHLLSSTILFADEVPATAPSGSGAFTMVMGIFVFLLALFCIFILPSKSRDKQTQKLLDSIKTNDKVLTYGGVIGTVCSVDRQAGEIVLRVDDQANVKIHFALSSVYFVYNKEAAKEAKEKAKKEKK